MKATCEIDVQNAGALMKAVGCVDNLTISLAIRYFTAGLRYLYYYYCYYYY
jgi:hypothetical protein